MRLKNLSQRKVQVSSCILADLTEIAPFRGWEGARIYLVETAQSESIFRSLGGS